MWLGGLEIPDALLEAHRGRQLVIFAGAGVSVPRPSGIPTFAGMVAVVERESGLPRRKSEPFDVYLGRADASGYPVHERVEAMISSAGRENALHRAILSLFQGPSNVRIVTTNFDRLLTKAAEARWPSGVREYGAPALPLGEDARGIVYLHGAVGSDPSSLVLTDSDFGRAYLTQGFARRFLVELFTNSVVLFIGYSHRDTVLTYLARGLPPRVEPRFALVRAGDEERWAALSIEPIVYATKKGRAQHLSVVSPLAEWGRYLGMAFGDHREEVRRIVRQGPGGDRQTQDYLRARILDPDTVTFFCEEASDTAWLEWISGEPFFQTALSRQDAGAVSEVDAALAWWFAERFASAHPTEALVTLARLGGHLSPTAWRAVAHRLWTQRPGPDDFARWLPVLLASAPDDQGDLLDYLLSSSRQGADDKAAVLLLDFLTQPLPAVEGVAGWLSEDGRETARISVQVRGDRYWLAESYPKVFRDRMVVFARPLLELVSHHLGHAHAISAAGGQANDHWDPISFHRSAIEPHDQDSQGLRDWWDVLIDAGRDAAEWASGSEPDLARSFVTLWSDSPAPLLRRLAVHTVSSAPWMDADARLDWLIEKALVFSTPAHHEVYRLLSDAYPKATDAARERLLTATDEGPVEPRVAADPELAARVIYDLLHWLSQARPDDAALQSRIEGVLRTNPDLRPSSHPELLSWMESGSIGSPPGPIDMDELLRRDPNHPGELDWLLSFQPVEPDLGYGLAGPRGPLLETVTSASTANPVWGLSLATALSEREEWTSDLWDSLAESWGRGNLDEAQWGRALDLLLGHPNLGAHAGSLARMLEDAIRSAPPLIPTSQLPVAESVARILWRQLIEASLGSPPAEVEDWLERAINDPAGQLATFFLHSFTIARAGGATLDGERRALFESILGGNSYQEGLASAVICSQTHFLYAVDREWTLNALAPVMDWSLDPVKARQAWDGFLAWGRLSPALVDDFLPAYESAFAHIPTFGRLRDRFTEHLSVVAFLTSKDPVKTGWLLRFITQAEATDIVAWTRFVTHQLRSMSDDVKKTAWDSWLNRYWGLRIEGNPRPIASLEGRAMAAWPLHLPPVFEEAVGRVCATPPVGADDLFYELQGSDLPERHPEAVVRLLHHVLSGQERPFWHCDYVVIVGRRVAATSGVPRSEIAGLVDQLLRLHCPGAEAILGSPGTPPEEESG